MLGAPSPDADLAWRIGRTVAAVRSRRYVLKLAVSLPRLPGFELPSAAAARIPYPGVLPGFAHMDGGQSTANGSP